MTVTDDRLRVHTCPRCGGDMAEGANRCGSCKQLPVIPEAGAWVDEAVCASTDPELFFPLAGDNPRDAVAICNTCPVMAQCLEYALDIPSLDGIWGGTTMRQRGEIRARRRRAA